MLFLLSARFTVLITIVYKVLIVSLYGCVHIHIIVVSITTQYIKVLKMNKSLSLRRGISTDSSLEYLLSELNASFNLSWFTETHAHTHTHPYCILCLTYLLISCHSKAKVRVGLPSFRSCPAIPTSENLAFVFPSSTA